MDPQFTETAIAFNSYVKELSVAAFPLPHMLALRAQYVGLNNFPYHFEVYLRFLVL